MDSTDTRARNWAGNVAFRASRVATPTTLDELADVLRSADRAKVLGSGHCFNTIADTPGVHIRTGELDLPIRIDPAQRRVRTGAGIRYGDLARDLEREGWALSNLASLPHISVAGAIATGTHGSGDGVGSLARAVGGVSIMTADGEVRSWQRGDDGFDAAVVSLGALGVVTEVELDIEPSYAVAQTVYEGVPWDAVLADISAVTGLAYSTSMFTTWRDADTIDQLWLKQRTGPGTVDAPEEVFGARPAPARRHPLPGVSAQSCTEQLGIPGPWLARLPHFTLEYTPSNGDELQSEYLVPREHAAEALSAVRELAPLIAPLLQVCEVRTVAADELLLSGAYRTDVLGIHFTWLPDQPGVERLLPVLQDRLDTFRARPHWGKLFDVAGIASRLPALYPGWDRFEALRAELDPRGVFGNAFLDSLGLSAP